MITIAHVLTVCLPVPACMHTKRCLANKNTCGPAGGKLLSSSKQNSAHDCTMRFFPTWNACSLMWGQQAHLLVSHNIPYHPHVASLLVSLQERCLNTTVFFFSLSLRGRKSNQCKQQPRDSSDIFAQQSPTILQADDGWRGMPWQNFSLSCRTLFEPFFCFGLNPAPLCLHNVCRPVWLLWSLLV